jgi:hypothetical protein
MIGAMASCASCGAEGVALGQACPRCGAMPAPELELDVRARPAAKPAPPKKKVVEEVSLELAVDPRDLVAQRAAEGRGPQMTPMMGGSPYAGPGEAPRFGAAAASAQVVRGAPAGKSAVQPRGIESDLDVDARTLAEFGEPPASLLLTPMYAWRVLKRQRQLKTALAARQVEAEHAATVLEDALVAFAERVRPAAEKVAGYAVALEHLQRAEDVLRSRDKVLAAEQDAQKARLAQVDARLVKLEEEMVQAQTDERLAAQELSSTQGSLAREEAKLKRAESELKSAQQRESGGTG